MGYTSKGVGTAAALVLALGLCAARTAEAEQVQGADMEHAFELGMQAVESSRFADAIDAFEQCLRIDPTHHRARLELARLYYSQGRLDEARQHFQHVLSTNAPDAVKRNITSFLEAIDRKQAGLTELRTQRAWRVRWAAGAMYDDNVNVGPDATEIEIAPFAVDGIWFDRLQISPESRPSDAVGAFIHVSPHVAFDISDVWVLRGGATYHQSWLNNADAFALRHYGANIGFSRRHARGRTELATHYAHLDQGGDPYVDVIGLEPAFRKRTGKAQVWGLRGAVQHHDYRGSAGRDALYAKLTPSWSYAWAEGRRGVMIGIGATREDAGNAIHSSTGLEPQVGAHASLGRRAAASLHARYHLEWYEDRDELAAEDRRDRRLQASLSTALALTTSTRLELSYQFTRNRSTFDLYDYDRNIATVAVAGEL